MSENEVLNPSEFNNGGLFKSVDSFAEPENVKESVTEEMAERETRFNLRYPPVA